MLPSILRQCKGRIRTNLVIPPAFCCFSCCNLIILMISFSPRTFAPLRESHAWVNFEDLLRHWGQSGVWLWQSCFPWMLPHNNAEHKNTEREMKDDVKFYVINTLASFKLLRISVWASTSLRTVADNVYLVFTLIIVRWHFTQVNSDPALFFLLLQFDNESFAKIKWFIVSPHLLLLSQTLQESGKKRDFFNRAWGF